MDEVEAELQRLHGEGEDEEEEGEDEEETTLNHADVAEDTEMIGLSSLHEEENSFTYQILLREAGDVKLPSTLWAMHKDPIGRFVAFSRMPIARIGRLIADKAVVFAGHLVPSVFFREMRLKLPIGVPTQPLDSLHQVSAYLHKIHRLAFCAGTGLQDPIRSMKCRIYVDMPSSMNRCTACSSQRQTTEENKT